MRYPYLLFDLDGTLISSHEGIYHCMKIALKEQGMVELNAKLLRKSIGPPLHVTLTKIWGLDKQAALKAEQDYRQAYDKFGCEKCSLIDGADSMLKCFKNAGYSLALATSKPLKFARRILQNFSIDGLFDVIVGSGLDGSLPDKKSVIEECVKQLGASKGQCLMIGDRIHDVEGAKLAGVDCAIVNVGYAEQGEFEREIPTYFWDGYEGLQSFLLSGVRK